MYFERRFSAFTETRGAVLKGSMVWAAETELQNSLRKEKGSRKSAYWIKEKVRNLRVGEIETREIFMI